MKTNKIIVTIYFLMSFVFLGTLIFSIIKPGEKESKPIKEPKEVVKKDIKEAKEEIEYINYEKAEIDIYKGKLMLNIDDGVII